MLSMSALPVCSFSYSQQRWLVDLQQLLFLKTNCIFFRCFLLPMWQEERCGALSYRFVFNQHNDRLLSSDILCLILAMYDILAVAVVCRFVCLNSRVNSRFFCFEMWAVNAGQEWSRMCCTAFLSETDISVSLKIVFINSFPGFEATLTDWLTDWLTD